MRQTLFDKPRVTDEAIQNGEGDGALLRKTVYGLQEKVEDLRRRYIVDALLAPGHVHQDIEGHLLQLLVRLEAEEAEEQFEVAYALDFHALKYSILYEKYRF